MCGFECFGNLEGEFEGFFDRDGAVFQPVGECVAFDEFEDEEARSVERDSSKPSTSILDPCSGPSASDPGCRS